MKTAIAYSSKHGTTEKVAAIISEKLAPEEVTLLNLDKNKRPDIGPYERIIIGGPIYAGTVPDKVKAFCEENLEALTKKELGLFTCYMSEEKKEEQFKNAFPEVLRKHSKANGFPGGELLFEKMNFFEKLMVRIAAKTSKSTSNLHMEEIDHFVKEMKK